jgi:flagellin
MYKVASGRRINSAADGASDLAIAQKMSIRNTSVEQADRNTQNGLNMIKTADGAMTNIASTLSTIREKLVNYANDTNGTTERSYIITEVNSLLSSIDSIASNTSFNGVKLLDGTWDSDDGSSNYLSFQTSADGGQTTTVNIASMTLESLGLNELTLDNEENDGAGNGAAEAAEAITLIDTALGTVNTALTNLGSTENKLGFISDNLAIESENLQASESTIRNLDVAKGMAQFALANILTQSSQFMLAQAAQNPYSALQQLQQQ